MASLLRSTKHVRTVYCRCHTSLATSPAPPLLLKLRSDLKTALKAKDTARLNVLRALLADVTNASKTSKPLRTDLELLSVLRRRAASSRQAIQEFQTASRQDLVEKEKAQVDILEEYAGGVKTIGETEIRQAVSEAIKGMEAEQQKLDQGRLMKSLVGPGGVFEGKPVEKTEVARIVREYMA